MILTSTACFIAATSCRKGCGADVSGVVVDCAACDAPSGRRPNWILVDFFNTTTPSGKPSRTLQPNPDEGLIRAVYRINAARCLGALRRSALKDQPRALALRHSALKDQRSSPA